uniref:Regulatory factor X, 3 (influences HLA class II expression) n=1 Tax=Astyanax mexicanus TaxID=7994 RepID=A0A8B9JRU2_ASTMX
MKFLGIPTIVLQKPPHFRGSKAQTVQQVQHVYPAQVQYVEENSGVYTNGTIRTYSYTEPQMYSQNSSGNYFDTQGSSSQVTTVVTSHSMANNGNGLPMGLSGGQIISSSGAYLIGDCRWGESASLHALQPLPSPLYTRLYSGNSKYHYYGIRVKPDSPLNRLQEDMQYMALRQQPVQQKQRYKPVQKMDGFSGDNYPSSGQHTPNAAEQTVIAQSQHHQQFLDASRALPEFVELDLGEHGVEDVSMEDIKALQTLYREHCEAILDVVVNLQFSLIEKLWQTFWRYSPSNTVEGATIIQNSGVSEIEGRLPRARLLLLCRSEAVLKWMSACDHLMYQALVEILIPDVLRPIPSALTQAIRNFAKSLEGWLTNAMSAIPQKMIQTKVSTVSAFAQTLRRYTSLNHLAQAARAVLQNTSQINQMLSDLNRVDFVNVQEQASWVCQCEEGVVQRLEQDFKATLQQQSSLEQWAAWLDNVVCQVLKPYEDRPTFPKAARQFLLKWSFYSSMVIRDLTLRSAASFGSFHLIRLLYDEYMFYLVEHRVAQATGATAIGVMGEFGNLNAMLPTNIDKGEQCSAYVHIIY